MIQEGSNINPRAPHVNASTLVNTYMREIKQRICSPNIFLLRMIPYQSFNKKECQTKKVPYTTLSLQLRINGFFFLELVEGSIEDLELSQSKS